MKVNVFIGGEEKDYKKCCDEGTDFFLNINDTIRLKLFEFQCDRQRLLFSGKIFLLPNNIQIYGQLTK